VGKKLPQSTELLRRPEMAKFLKIMKNSKGATAIEYGLIAALIAVAAIAAMQNIGTKLGTTFNNVSNALYAVREPRKRRCGNAPPFFF
jgi:pilus assembly protein Flp/PilA